MSNSVTGGVYSTDTESVIILDSELRILDILNPDHRLGLSIKDKDQSVWETAFGELPDVRLFLTEATNKPLKASDAQLLVNHNLHYQIKSHPIANPRCATCSFLVSIKELTQAHKNAHYLEYIQASTNTGVWQYDKNSKAFYGSAKALDVLKIPHSTPPDIALGLVQFTSKALLKFKLCLKRAEQGGAFSENFELKENGVSRWVHFQGEHVENSNQVDVISGTVTDATDKVYSDAQLAFAVEAGQIGLWLWDRELDKLFWNDQMYQLYGTTQNDEYLTFNDWEKRVHFQDVNSVIKAFNTAISKNQDFLRSFRIVTDKGDVRHIKARAKPIRNDAGQVIKCIGVNTDITDIRKEQEAVIEERERRYSTERLAALGELASGVGHEINNPLAVILGQLELLQHDEVFCNATDKRALERIETMQEAGFRIRDIVAGMKSLSRDESGQKHALIDINSLLEAVERFTKQLYRHNKINLRFNPLPQSCKIKGHFGEIQQVVLNLISNAKDAVEQNKDKSINVSASVDATHVHLIVEDNGIGIAQDKLTSIFDSFYTSKPTGKGTGLGLSIVKRIVNNHLGQIDVFSTPSEGTRFEILLPIVNAASDEGSDTETDIKESSSYPHMTILLVDDEPEILEICEMYLMPFKAQVQCFNSGETLLEEVTNIDNAILITDMTLERMNGIELLQSLKEKFKQDVPAILMTGGLPDERTDRLAQQLFHTMLPKPFSMLTFTETVESVLRHNDSDEEA